jgi:TolA-binding protein
MKRLIALLVLLGVVLAAPAYSADEKQDGSLWERLRKKIELLTPKKKIQTTTAVGGVRGAQADADDVYWKGEAANSQTIDADELEAFKKAISLVEAGDVAGAHAAFSDFLKKHPDSRLREDAEMAIAQLQPKK